MGIRTRVGLAASTVAIAALGMFSVTPTHAQDTGKVTGTISYRDRSALPDNAEITVQLADVSRQDVAATVIAEQKFTSGGKQVPFPFELTYDPTKIDEKFTYAVQVTIIIDGNVVYRNTQAYLVITQGRPTNVDVVVQRVSGASQEPTATAAPAGGIGGGYKVSGTVGILERIALPETGVETLVQLVDVSNANAPKVITEQRIPSNGQQPPYTFDLIYNPALANDTPNYLVRASISIAGVVRYRSTDEYRIAPNGTPVDNVDGVNVIVRRVSDDEQSTPSGPVTLPADPSSARPVAGGAAPTNALPGTLPTTGSENFIPFMLVLAALALLACGVLVRLRVSQRS